MPSTKKLLQAAAGNAGESLYVEDVFSTYLYTGTGTAPAINNGIDLMAKVGWFGLKNVSGLGMSMIFPIQKEALFPKGIKH
jgi:hypothetical protein